MEQLIYCLKCCEIVRYEDNQTYFDDKGIDYSTKLVQCPKCQKPIVISYYNKSMFQEFYK